MHMGDKMAELFVTPPLLSKARCKGLSAFWKANLSLPPRSGSGSWQGCQWPQGKQERVWWQLPHRVSRPGAHAAPSALRFVLSLQTHAWLKLFR